MIKIIKTIVGPDRKLLGFIMEGKEKEFGGLSSEKTIRPVSLAELQQKNFSNNQISAVGGRFVTANGFKINSVPMCVFDGANYTDVDNTVNLTKRFVKDNENIGFEVTFADGSKQNLTYESIGALANWYKPGNFVIRVSSNNKYYISGKPGVLKISDLPAEVLGEESKAKKTKSAAKDADKTKKFDGELINNFDIIDIYEFIAGCNGCVIKLPSEKYTGQDQTSAELEKNSGFVSLNIGEVASPYPMFNSSKLNVNAGFKKVGVVRIPLNGMETPVTTFVYRTKSIFYNGDNNMKKFGIAVPADKEKELISTLGASLALSKIEDPALTGPMNQVINAPSLVFYNVDTSNIALISDRKRDENIMNAAEISKLLGEKFVVNLITKAFSPKTGLIKEIKDTAGESFVAMANDKKLFGIFATMNTDALNQVTAAGIDVYTGAFNPVRALGGSSKPAKSSDGESTGISIEYLIKGRDINKMTYKVIKDAALREDTSVLPKKLIDMINGVLSITNPTKQLLEAQKIFEEANKRMENINKKFWLHNASMYIEGNKIKIHTRDSKDWTLNTSSRLKNGKEYIYTGADVEGLAVRVQGVEI